MSDDPFEAKDFEPSAAVEGQDAAPKRVWLFCPTCGKRCDKPGLHECEAVAGEAEPRPSEVLAEYRNKLYVAELSAPSDTAPTQHKLIVGNGTFSCKCGATLSRECWDMQNGTGWYVEHLEAELSGNRLTALQQWKDSAMEVLGRWDKVADYTRDHGGRLGHDSSEETLRVLQAAEEQVRKLRDGLKNYGHHAAGCAIPPYGLGNKYFDKTCTCGFAELLNGEVSQ
jgi:hypothetical protein